MKFLYRNKVIEFDKNIINLNFYLKLFYGNQRKKNEKYKNFLFLATDGEKNDINIYAYNSQIKNCVNVIR